jgi:hypothetical protein
MLAKYTINDINRQIINIKLTNENKIMLGYVIVIFVGCDKYSELFGIILLNNGDWSCSCSVLCGIVLVVSRSVVIVGPVLILLLLSIIVVIIITTIFIFKLLF